MMDDTTTTAIAPTEVSPPDEPLTEPVETQRDPSPSFGETPEASDLEGGEPQPYLDEDRFKDIGEGPPPVEDEPHTEEQEAPSLWSLIETNYQPEQLQELAQELVWQYFKDESGELNLGSIQTLIDSITTKPGSVLAGDLIAYVAAVEDGTIDPTAIAKDIEHYDKYRQLQNETYQAKYTQESHERKTAINQFVQSNSLMPNIQSTLDKFNLLPNEEDSRFTTDFKNSLEGRIAYAVDSFAASNPHLRTFQEMLHSATLPGGPTLEDLQRDTQFQISYQRGFQELHTHINKSIARECLFLKYARAGYEALHPPTTDETNA